MSDDLVYVADKFMFRVPRGLLYSREDAWVRLENGVARVGVTDLFQRLGGDALFVEPPALNQKVEPGGVLARFETIKVVLDVLSPVGGYVAELNPRLESSPELVNGDPYGAGWVAGLNPMNLNEENLLTAEEYFDWMKQKIDMELKKIRGTG